MLVLRFWQRC